MGWPVQLSAMSIIADPSLRFVLPEGAPYLKNMAAIWAADAKLAAAIEQTEGQESYPCQLSKSGHPTVSVKTGDGRVFYLHSKYEPKGEAEILISSISADENFAFFIHGFGLGYHVERLFDRASDEAIFCVIENDLLMLRTAFEQRDLSRLIESGRVLFFTKLDKADLFVRLSSHNGLLSLGCASIKHAASVQLAKEYNEQMETWIAEFRDTARTGLNTLIVNGR